VKSPGPSIVPDDEEDIRDGLAESFAETDPGQPNLTEIEFDDPQADIERAAEGE
jgi:hypothetical protein